MSLGKSMKSGFWRRQWAKRSIRKTTRLRGVPWRIIALVLLATVALPTLLDVSGRRLSRLPHGFQYVCHRLYTVTSLMVVWESLAAWRLPPLPPPGTEGALPGCTAIIAAYLPNEQDIILETVPHMLGRVDVPADRSRSCSPTIRRKIFPWRTAAGARRARSAFGCCASWTAAARRRMSTRRSRWRGRDRGRLRRRPLARADCFRQAWRWLKRVTMSSRAAASSATSPRTRSPAAWPWSSTSCTPSRTRAAPRSAGRRSSAAPTATGGARPCATSGWTRRC